MNNINQTIYNIYNNIDVFYEYRGLVSLDTKISQKELNAQMQKDKYIIFKSIKKNDIKANESVDTISKYVNDYNEKTKAKDLYITYILLIYINTDVESKRANMIKLINHIRYPKAEVLIITPTKLSSSIQKYISELHNVNEHKYRTFKPYTYSLLKTIIPKFELVPKYEILNEEQIAELNKFYINRDILSKIYEHDPQMVWIGAKVGDVIKYTYISEVTIDAIGYCVVIAQD